MENKKRMPATVLAQMEVFDYLKEKVGERKTRTEAYCDLLDKAMAGFVSSYLRRQDYELRPCQCHVTVSDLAVEWRWHRATVRSFLDTLESFGLLTRIRLPKSVVITMAVQSGHGRCTVRIRPCRATAGGTVRLGGRLCGLLRDRLGVRTARP